MPREQVNQLQNLGIPFRGMSSDLPSIGLPPDQCLFMENLEFRNGVLQERNGIRRKYLQGYNGSPDVFVNQLGAIGRGINNGITAFMLGNTGTAPQDFYAVEIDGNTGVQTLKSFTQAPSPANSFITICPFAGRIFAFRSNSTPGVYDFSTFAAVGFTGPTLQNCIGAAEFNSRMYVMQAGFSPLNSLYYSATAGAIAGAFTQYPLVDLLPSRDQITNIFSFTASTNISSEQLLGVVTEGGSCLIFRGDDPGDPNWEVAGRFSIGSPVGIQSWIAVDGDILLMLDSGIVSMRSVMQSGAAASRASLITDSISTLWRELVRQVNATGGTTLFNKRGNAINGVLDQSRNRLVISFPVQVKLSTSSIIGYDFDLLRSCFLIYDFNAQSWSIFTFPENSAVQNLGYSGLYYNEKFQEVLFGRYVAYQAESYILSMNADSFTDTDQAGGNVNIRTDLLLGAIFNNKQQRISDVVVLHSGTGEEKGKMRVGLRPNIAGAFREQALALSSGPSVDGYNIGESSKFLQLRFRKTGEAFVSGESTTPYQLANISILTQSGGIL